MCHFVLKIELYDANSENCNCENETLKVQFQEKMRKNVIIGERKFVTLYEK